VDALLQDEDKEAAINTGAAFGTSTAVTIVNINDDGGTMTGGESGVDWFVDTTQMATAAGGLLGIQDLRADLDQGVTLVKKMCANRCATRGGEEPVLTGAYAVMEKMDGRMEEGGDKPMGGVYLGAWGALASRFQAIPGGRDRFGRWVAGRLRGKDGRKQMVVNCYRAPAGCKGGLVARELFLRAWDNTPANTLKARDYFFEELGSAISGWKAEGYEIILMGDFKISSELRATFREWCQ